MGASSTHESGGSAEQSVTLTRRGFLAGATGAAALATNPSHAAPVAGESRADRGRTYGTAQISREGYHLLATLERQQQQQGNDLQFNNQVNAVEDLGLDPTGSDPIQDRINRAAVDGMLIVFPPGTYRVTGEINPGVSGAFGIAGAGYQTATQPPKPGGDTTTFRIHTETAINLFNIGPVDQGVLSNFVIDQRKPAAHGGIQVLSSGNFRVQNIRNIGALTTVGADDNPGFLTPLAETADSLVVVSRFIARGGGIPGTKNIGGSAGIGIFGRTGERGTIVLNNCVIENMADNGIYGARTAATVHVLGGLYRNNDVCQVRVNGDARIDGVDVIIDESHYTGLKSKSNARERGPGWPAAQGIMIETLARASSNTGTPIRNCNVVGNSVAPESAVGALVNVWDSGGAVTLDNCRITNHIPRTVSVLGQQPGSGTYAAAPRPWQIVVKNSVIQGRGAGQGGATVDVRGRPRSLVNNTCFAYQGASRTDIQGAGISGVSFGQCTRGRGLTAPEQVGSNVSLSTLNLSAPNMSYAGAVRDRTGPSKGVLTTVLGGTLMIVLLLLGLLAVFVGGLLGLIGTLAGVTSGD